MSSVRVLVGTHKGAFVIEADGKRDKWKVSEPHFAGWDIYHLKGSPVDPNRIYASQTSGWFGQIIQRSDDGGKTWYPARRKARRRTQAWPAQGASNKFSYDTYRANRQAAHHPSVVRRHASTPGSSSASGISSPRLSDPDTVYAGVEDAALFQSTDGGETWHELSGAARPRHRAHMAPGAGGMGLHTILLDPSNPDRIYIAISAAGAFRTDDAGQTWKPINKGLVSNFMPDPTAEIGHCVHHIAIHPSRPDVLFMQKHWDVMRSDNAGDTWNEVSGNLPTDFGFCHRRPCPRARNPLRRSDQERLAPLPARWQTPRLPQQIRRQRLGTTHQRTPPERLLRQRASGCHGRRLPRGLRHLLRHHRRPGLYVARRWRLLEVRSRKSACRPQRRGSDARVALVCRAEHDRLT